MKSPSKKPALHRLAIPFLIHLGFLPNLIADPIGDALGQPGLVWTSSGDLPWFVETAVTHDGVSALRSGAIGDSQDSTLSTTVNGPVVLHFWWKVSSEHSDYLTFTANYGGNQVLTRITSREIDWQPITITLGPGPNLLSWTYSKDRSDREGQDAGWLDEITFSDVPPAAPTVTNASFPVTTLAGKTISLGAAVTGFPLSFQWLQNGQPIPGATQVGLTLTNAQPEMSGHYQLVVSNQLGVARSQDMIVYIAQPLVFKLISTFTVTNGTVKGLGFATLVPQATNAPDTATGRRPRPANVPPANTADAAGLNRLLAYTDKGTLISRGGMANDLVLGSTVATTGKPAYANDYFYSAAAEFGVAYASGNLPGFSTPQQGFIPLPKGSGSAVAVKVLDLEGSLYLVVQTANPASLIVTGPIRKGFVERFTSFESSTTYSGEPFASGTPVNTISVCGKTVALGTDSGTQVLGLDSTRKLSVVGKIQKDPKQPTGPSFQSQTSDLAPGPNNGTLLGFVGPGYPMMFNILDPSTPSAQPFIGPSSLPATDFVQRSLNYSDLSVGGNTIAVGTTQGYVVLGDCRSAGDADSLNFSPGCGLLTLPAPPTDPRAPVHVAISPGDPRFIAVERGNTVGTYFLVKVGKGPEIIEQPVLSKFTTDPVPVTVTAEGDGELKYQWFYVDRLGIETLIPGETEPSLGILSLRTEGEYFVRVSNAIDSIDSDHTHIVFKGTEPPILLEEKAANRENNEVDISWTVGPEVQIEVNTGSLTDESAWRIFEIKPVVTGTTATITFNPDSLASPTGYIRAKIKATSP